MRKVRLYYPTCIIEGYLNDEGQFADMDGVLFTMTTMPERMSVEPGELPDIPFTAFLEQANVPTLHVPKPIIKLRTLLSTLKMPEREVDFNKIVNQLEITPATVELATVLNTLPEPERAKLVSILGNLDIPEATIELLQMWNSLPEQKRLEFIKVLGNLETEEEPMVMSEQEMEDNWEDIELDEEAQEVLGDLFLRYGH